MATVGVVGSLVDQRAASPCNGLPPVDYGPLRPTPVTRRMRTVSGAVADSASDYEAERERRIAANKARMRALGLGCGHLIGGGETNAGSGYESPAKRTRSHHHRNAERNMNLRVTARACLVFPVIVPVVPRSHAIASLVARLDAGDPSAPKLKQCGGGRSSRSRRGGGETAPPPRASGRLRGFDPTGAPVAAAPVATTAPRHALLRELDDDAKRAKGAPGRRGLEFPDPADFPGEIAAPFSLASIGVTVLNLGKVHRGAFAPRYWSSKGCLFHHAYPVGYRARKVHFDRSWVMTIEAGEFGPVFRVTDEQTGETFDGPSPTKPWTAVCVSKRLKTRISGPLFFGFSDVVTMRALATLYTAEELRACRAGGVVASEEMSVTERCVAELCTLEGVGEKTAIALASTASLSRVLGIHKGDEGEGRRITSLNDLRACVNAPGGGLDAVRAFLLESPEMPAITLRWPAWRARVVPKIISQLLDGPLPAEKISAAPDGDVLKEENGAETVAGKRRARAGGKAMKRARQSSEGLENVALSLKVRS